MTDWRKRFLTKASETVKIDMMTRGTKATCVAFAEAAKQKTGLAFWRDIDIKKVRLYSARHTYGSITEYFLTVGTC